jgi:hypothetical protein
VLITMDTGPHPSPINGGGRHKFQNLDLSGSSFLINLD